jgi:DNA-binding MarR family transcriptional regulator
MLTIWCYSHRVPTDNSTAFRRFTRAVFAAQAAVLRHGDTANAAIGQSSARWRVLRAIDDGHTSVAAAARFMGSSRQSVQRLADALIAEGLVEAEGQGDDRRLKLLRLTAEGQRVHDALEANFDTWADRLLTHVGADDLEAVSQGLEQITYIVNADREYLLRKGGNSA